jgi:hypothetical protein
MSHINPTEGIRKENYVKKLLFLRTAAFSLEEPHTGPGVLRPTVKKLSTGQQKKSRPMVEISSRFILDTLYKI